MNNYGCACICVTLHPNIKASSRAASVPLPGASQICKIHTQQQLKDLPCVVRPPAITLLLGFNAHAHVSSNNTTLQHATLPPAMCAAADHARTLAHKRLQARHTPQKQRAQARDQQQKRSQPKPATIAQATSHATASVSADEAMRAVQSSAASKQCLSVEGL